VVGQQDAVDAQVDEALGVLHRLDTLDDDLARPHGADDLEVLVADGGVHGVVEQLAHGAAGGLQGGELQLGRGQEVEPPPRAGDRVEDGAGRDLGRDGEAVALVAQAGPGHGGVHGEHEGVEAGGRGALDQPVGDLALAHDVELEPVAPVGVGGLDVLDGGGAQRGQGEGDPGGAGGPGPGDLALGLHEAGETGGRDTEGHGRAPAQDFAGGVDVDGRAQDVGVELDVAEGLAGAAQGDLTLGGAVGVVEGRGRSAALGDLAQVPGGQCGVEAATPGVELGRLEVEQLEDLARVGQLALDHRNLIGESDSGRSARRGVLVEAAGPRGRH